MSFLYRDIAFEAGHQVSMEYTIHVRLSICTFIIDIQSAAPRSSTPVFTISLSFLQVVRRFWNKNDMKGAIEAMKKMTDHSVSALILEVSSHGS